MTHRLFHAALPVEGGRVSLSPVALRHARVLRLSAGDRVRLFDGRGGEADAVVAVLRGDLLECAAAAREAIDDDGPRIALVLGVPKGGKLESVVRATTELGVSSIHLAICERGVARPSQPRAHTRVARLERVAREASRQSRRPHVPLVVAPAPLGEVVERAADGDGRVLFWERATTLLERDIGRPPLVWVVVGPEGGLSETEVDALEDAGFRARSLGRTTLRVETAATAAVALVADRLGSAVDVRAKR